MELGISVSGFILDLAFSKKFNNLSDLLLEANEACLTYAEENDIKVCELVLDPPDVISNEIKRNFIDMCNGFSIKKRVHGPITSINMCSNNSLISKASVESLIDTARICNQINAETLTVHPGSEGFVQIESLFSFNKKRLIESVDNLLDATSDLAVKICIENMPNVKGLTMLIHLKDIEQFFKDINRNDIFMTWDTSHSWTSDIDLEMLWKKFHNIIKNIHIVDNHNKTRDTHPAIGSGKIDFQEIFDLIKKYDYNGALIVELMSAKGLSKSLDFVKKFL